jgi:sensor histidine kinase YesM
MQKKIFTLFIAVLALPSFLIFLGLIRVVTDTLKKSAVVSLRQLNDEVIDITEDRLLGLSQFTMQVYYNESLMDQLEHSFLRDGSVENEELLSRILKSFINTNRYLATIYLRTDEGDYVEGMPLVSADVFWDYRTEEPTDEPGRVLWIPTMRVNGVLGGSYRCFAARRQIRKDNHRVATLLLVFRESFFDRAYRNLLLEQGQTLTILADDGTVVSASERDSIGLLTNDPFLLGLRSMTGGRMDGNSAERRVNGEPRIAVYGVSDITGWLFVNEIPVKVVLKAADRLRSFLLILAIPYAAFLLSVTYILSRHLALPLRRLATAIDSIGEGRLDTAVPTGDDEIGHLSGAIIVMADRISALLARVKEEERRKNQAELRYLQMQLSPHFVYNTLNTVKWMAVMNRQDNIRDVVEALVKLMRNVSDPGEPTISLRRELELIRSYVQIQRVRYSDFSLDIAVPDGLLNCEIPKFVVQNLVENTIVHGIAGMESQGRISIRAGIEGDTLVIGVEDNGTGFPSNAGSPISPEADPEHAHTGLDGIRERIRLSYGEEYGVTVRNGEGMGALVSLRLPIRRQEES